MVLVFLNKLKSLTWTLKGFRRKNFQRPLTVLYARRLRDCLLMDHLLMDCLFMDHLLLDFLLMDYLFMNVLLIVWGSSSRSTSNFPPNKFNVDAEIWDRVTNQLIQISSSTFSAVCGDRFEKPIFCLYQFSSSRSKSKCSNA